MGEVMLTIDALNAVVSRINSSTQEIASMSDKFSRRIDLLNETLCESETDIKC